MATGRIGTTPVLTTRWSKAPNAGTTSLSGLDDNSVSLVYSVGYEAVYQNGVLLSRGNDYTATNGTTITLTTATVAGDIIEVFANNVVPLTDTYSQSVADGKFVNNTIVDAKGDLIVGSAADTFTRLAVGSANQVLTVDSATTSGLKWASAGFSDWTTWTPTWTNLTVGNGTVTARYTQDNKVVIATLELVFGSTTSITSNNPRFSLPVTAVSASSAINRSFGSYWDASNVHYPASCEFFSTSAVNFQTYKSDSTYVQNAALTTTAPFTWGTNDYIYVTTIYEAA